MSHPGFELGTSGSGAFSCFEDPTTACHGGRFGSVPDPNPRRVSGGGGLLGGGGSKMFSDSNVFRFWVHFRIPRFIPSIVNTHKRGGGGGGELSHA